MGSRIAKVQLCRKDLRIPFPKEFAKRLEGRKIKDISRRAKYLLFTLDGGLTLIAHLGMSGRFSIPALVAGAGYNKHDHVILTLGDGRQLVYNDARRFGLMTLAKTKDLGAEVAKT
jgi:formamidopyrimidine-DNA glycosylase